MDFAVPADHRVKIRESKRRDKFLDLIRELRNLWNMSLKVILIVIDAFGTVSKGKKRGLEELEIGGQFETIQITTY